jgi:hypothetical protein
MNNDIPFFWCNKKMCVRRAHFLLPPSKWEDYHFADLLFIVLGQTPDVRESVWRVNGEVSQFICDYERVVKSNERNICSKPLDESEEVGTWDDNSSIYRDIYDGEDNDSIFNHENFKTYNYKEINSNKPFIYVRKNSSKNGSSINSSCRKKNSINNSICRQKEFSYKDKVNKNKIRVNLKLNHIFENAFYVQKNVILIQKNYRMHLGILKKYILKAIENIIVGTNKLYYIFYKYYFKKLKYIMNDAFIKSISVNMKSTNNRMNSKNRYISNEINNNLFSKTKKYYMVNRYKRNKNVKIVENKNSNNFLLNSKNEQNYNFCKTQKGDIILIQNLKNQKNK